MPHSPVDRKPLGDIAGEFRKIAAIIDGIAARPQEGARDHTAQLGQIREALGDVAAALQRLAEGYKD